MKLRAPAPGSPPRTPARWGGKGEGALTLEELDGCTAGLVALAGRAALDGRRHGVGGLLDRLVGVFGRDGVYVELQRHLRRDEERDNDALVSLASAFRVPTIATNGVRFAAPADRPLFDVLTCIHHHTDLAAAGRRLAPNAERHLKPPADMAALFLDHPGACARTRELGDRLQYTMADLGYRFPDYPVPPGDTQISFLRKIADVGARERYRPYHDRARAQIARELDLIEKLQLAGYFLIVWDIVNFCRQHDVLVQGRGSAANSAVCYSLGITAVDPVGMDLLFERFLSEERGEWPDIDLDLPSGDRREQVIQHVYEKYGRLGAAMTANVITYRGRSAAREVGKTLGFDPVQVDRLAKVMNNFEFIDPADSLPRQMSAVGLDLNSDRVRLFARLWGEMQDLPRHLGQHSGGMVICQGQLDACVPLENASMPGRVVVQWDKDDCADMGIVKVDLLGLGMMAVIQDSLALVNGEVTTMNAEIAETAENSSGNVSSASSAGSAFNRRVVVDLAHLPQNDPAVYKMLCEADTIGVFQVESRAQMATLPRLKPKEFYDLVVQVAIIRPGPIVGQMVHPYLNRRAGREPVAYAHPSLEPILARTLGVPLFQEQLLRMAMVAAGFTGGQAEELRRAMGFKRSEKRMKQIEVQLRDGMARKGIAGDAAEQIITSIASFALYGFPESHAASFALLAYASAYLKVHFPAAFYTALLNNQPMGFYHPSTLVKDAQRRGVRFHPIDVQISDWDCTVEADGAIRLGLRYVNGLREQAGRAIASRQSSVVSPRSRRMLAQAFRPCLSEMRVRRSVDARAGRCLAWFCNNCSHDWSPRHRARALPLARRSRRARRPPPRRGRHARRRRRAERVRLRPPLRALAGRARRAAERRAVHDDENAETAEHAEIVFGTRFLCGSLRALRFDVLRRRSRVSAETDDRSRTAGRRLRGHGAHRRPPSDGAAARGAGDARHPARVRPARRAPGTPRARGRHGHHAPAPRHRQGLRLPHARGRDRHCEHHRPAGSVRARPPRHRRGAVLDRRRRAAEPGRRHLGARRTGPGDAAAWTSTSTPTTFISQPIGAAPRLHFRLRLQTCQFREDDYACETDPVAVAGALVVVSFDDAGIARADDAAAGPDDAGPRPDRQPRPESSDPGRAEPGQAAARPGRERHGGSRPWSGRCGPRGNTRP